MWYNTFSEADNGGGGGGALLAGTWGKARLLFNFATASLTGLWDDLEDAAVVIVVVPAADGLEALEGKVGLGEDVVIEMSVASGEAMGGREGLLMGDDCLGGNEGGASSTSVTSLFGDTDLTMWEKQIKELIGVFTRYLIYFSFLIPLWYIQRSWI